jgi:branched-chain amino acid transport system substrate-binding protein
MSISKFLASAAVAASAVFGAQQAAAQQAEALKLGVIAALSGGGTAWGQGLLRGVEIATEEVNASGGLKVGDKTYKLAVIPYDDQYNAAQAKTAAERLVHDEKVKFLFGPVGSPGGLSTVAVTQPAKVIQFVDGYAPKILDNEWKNDSYVFRTGLSSTEFSEPIVEWIKERMPDVKKIGIIAPNDAVGQQAITALVDRYKARGFEVWTDFYERGSKEFTPVLLRMVTQGIDLFDLNANPPGEAGLLIKQAREVGYTGKILQAGGSGVREIVEAVGSAAEGFLKYDVIDFNDPAVQPFVKKYEAKYSGPINGLAPQYYSAAHMLFEAIRRADSLDTTKIRDQLEALEGSDVPGLIGKLKWTGEKTYSVEHQIVIPFFIMKVENGKAVVEAKIVPNLD